jgi:hypothetical protein
VEEVNTNDINIIDDAQLNLIMSPEESAETNDEEEEEEDLSNITLEEPTENTNKSIIVIEEVDLDPDLLRKKTVVQLKEIAAQKNLQKYKSLTKKRLIDLISNSQ